MGVNPALFFLGSVIIALVIFVIRARSSSSDSPQGVLVGFDYMSPIEQVPNITQRLEQQAAGTYDPDGSATTSASYPGVFY